MSMIHRLLFIIILSNAGGQGKTTIARIIKALLETSGHHPVQILDADAGNAAASILDPNSERLGWGVQATVGPQIVEAYSGRHVILDLGANTMASAREIADMLPELTTLFEKVGYSSLAIYPVTPNKPGALGALEKLMLQLPAQEKMLVLNNADGTGNFEQPLPTLPTARLGALKPGFMDYVNALDSRSFSEAVFSPAPDRTIAAQHIAEWMRNFARDLPLQDAFLPALNRLGEIPKPTPIRFQVPKASDTSNVKLVELAHRSAILKLLDAHGWDKVGLGRAADELEIIQP
ncbi:hypothetical protein [Aurantiacibacter suaedae]|uniref:hypothetical protein n=1 Tax=Aurantiacibacter suaedae TaxID=2545755 RepID=UPI0010F9922B|nr:hypothetical protein [Aurantiacibacter suaedae]